MSTKIGIIICDRYRTCAGGKCLRALKNREGAFSTYKDEEVELAGYTTCNGCPGGNVEYAGEEMVKNGAQVVHLATGLLVGYPPCPYIDVFKKISRRTQRRKSCDWHTSHSAEIFGNGCVSFELKPSRRLPQKRQNFSTKPSGRSFFQLV
jgi:predicted metal-binding protein